jgi:ribonuclease Z
VTQIVFLGTGTPNPDPERQGPCVAIIAEEKPYLFDCGTGVVRQAMKAQKRGIEALAIENLTQVFITHLHSDHTIGLPDLMLTPAVTGREVGLDIYGPVGTAAMVKSIQQAWSQDITTRLSGGEPSIANAYKVKVHENEQGAVFSDGNITVKAFPVSHGTWRKAFGFRVETADKVIVLSGDSTYNETLISNSLGCDVLIHEAYSAAGLAKRTPDWQKYHSSFHTSGVDLARLATIVKPKLLLLYHLLPFTETVEQIVEEVKAGYGGEVVAPDDLDVF